MPPEFGGRVSPRRLRWPIVTAVLGAAGVLMGPSAAARLAGSWQHLSSARGELPNPAGSSQQTGALVARLDGGPAPGLVISGRREGPALVWIRKTESGWERSVIEHATLQLEAGGAAHDIDADGDLDIVFGEDASGDRLFWWENPFPQFHQDRSWTRRTIKAGGARQHHDQIFADLKGTGRPQLVYWNQGAKTLLIADVPADPRRAAPWPADVVFSGPAGERVGQAAAYAEGLDAFDVDGDGRLDLLAGNYWFSRRGGTFLPVRIGEIGGRIRAGRFREGSRAAQVVVAPGDGSGPLRLYEATGDPAISASWSGRDLLDRDMVHGHTLEVGDVNGDGHLDVFAAEMAKWTAGEGVDHPKATAWILYGDGRGQFRTTVLVEGHGWHEGRLADADGDGDLDVWNKPYAWNAPRLDLWRNESAR